MRDAQEALKCSVLIKEMLQVANLFIPGLADPKCFD